MQDIMISHKQSMKNICLSIGAFFLFFGHNTALGPAGKILIYIGIFILLLYIVNSMCKHMTLRFDKEKRVLIGLFVLLSFGLVMQDELTLLQKASPIISFMIMVIFYVYGYHIIDSWTTVRLFGYVLLFTFIFSLLVSPLIGSEIIMRPTEGMSYALTGGLGHKNSSSISILASYMAISAYFKFFSKKKMDFIALILLVILTVAGASRSSWLLMIVYTLLLNFDILRRLKKNSKIIFFFIIAISVFLCGYIFFFMLISESQSYGVRIMGLYSYLFQYGQDFSVMILGHGDILYNDAYGDYDHRVWILLGGVGTFEIAYLDILSKNGLLGLMAYLYIYFSPIVKGGMSLSSSKIMLLSLSITALISGMVDIFISQIIYPYTILILCMLSFFYHENTIYKN